MRLEPTPSARYTMLTTLDYHTEGEPLRIINSGCPEPKGQTMLEKRHYLATHLDHYRRILMHEPRGHSDMYGALITAPVSPDSALGVLFLHNEGYSSMCGHGIIALVTALVDCGRIVVNSGEKQRIRIDTPAGIVTAHVNSAHDRLHIGFDNVPSYVFAR